MDHQCQNQCDDGKIALVDRGYRFHYADLVDLVVKITVEGNAIFFDRAKYGEHHGVQNRAPAFCIDVFEAAKAFIEATIVTTRSEP